MSDGYDGSDFERAVATVGGEPSPRALAERLGVDWDYLGWIALDAAAAVLGEAGEWRAETAAYGGEAFTAGFLVGAHLGPDEGVDRARAPLAAAVDAVQVRGQHAVIADHCDLAGVASLETVYGEALLESMALPPGEREPLRAPVTRLFEAGLAVGLELRSGGDGDGTAQEP